MTPIVRACLIGLATAFTPLIPVGAASATSPGFSPIQLDVKPIETFLRSAPDERFGSLEFRGGLELRSSDRRFGSLSGLDFAGDGMLFAVSDRGRWFTARPVERDGRLVGLADPQMAPILNNAGVPLAGKKWGDAEGLRIVGGEDGALVTFEQVNDLRQFNGDQFVLANSRSVALPGSVRTIESNRGLESVATARRDGPLGGATVVIAEQSLDKQGNHRGWIVGGPRRGRFSIENDSGYDITDATFLPDGDLLILERSLKFPLGIGMRIRRIAESDVAPGRTVAGKTLIEADIRHQIDNMEGLAAKRNAAGETIVAVVSDNNNNDILQRTLLLYFALLD